jgi:hypothetical protein
MLVSTDYQRHISLYFAPVSCSVEFLRKLEGQTHKQVSAQANTAGLNAHDVVLWKDVVRT